MPDAWETTDFDPTVRSAIYDLLLAEWKLNRDVAELHLNNLRDGSLLDEFGGGANQEREAEAVYEWRKAASFTLDEAASLIDVRVDNIFRTAPVRDFKDSPFKTDIERFLENVDGAGTDMSTFMKKHLPQHYTNGVDFIVDKPHTDGAEPQTLAQELDLNILPYVQAFGPMERLDWSVDCSGRFNWARYYLGTPPTVDELLDVGDVQQYLTLMPNEWRLYQTGNKDEGTMVLTGTHSLGMCPIVPFYFKESTLSGRQRVPLSLMTKIAPIARHLVNLISQIQIDVYRNVCFMVGKGLDVEKAPKSVAPFQIWCVPDGIEIDPVVGDVAHIIQKVKWAETLMQMILRLGKVSDATGESKTRAMSGVQVAVERTDLDSELRSTALQLQQVETEIVRMAMSRLKGKAIAKDDLGYSVKYCDTFILTDKAARIAHAKELLSIAGMGDNLPVLIRIVMTEVLDSFVHPDADVYEEAKAQIDAAEFSPMGPVEDEDEDTTEDTLEGVDAVDDTDEENRLDEDLT